MNVFILCTGRCGSVTFAKACENISNYSVGHESRNSLLGDKRFRYPDNHIEVDNRLAWLLGRLGDKYGDDAFYVHLTRNEEDVARSLQRGHGHILKHYQQGIVRSADCPEVALDCVKNINANIKEFLRHKHMTSTTIEIEKAVRFFPWFWERIGAEGNLGKALKELTVRHNAHDKRSG